MKKIRVHPDRCTGCDSCTLACSFYHEEIFSFHLSRIQVEKKEEFAEFQPNVCIQCEERPCVSACPEMIISIDSTGAVQIDEDKCTGCGTCASICPYDGIILSEDKKVPLVCDLCGGDPECVKACELPQALQYVTVSEVEDE